MQNWKAKWLLPRVNSRGWRGKNFVPPTAKAYATTQKPWGRGGAAPHAAQGRRKAEREGRRPAHPCPPGRSSTVERGLAGGARFGGGGARISDGGASIDDGGLHGGGCERPVLPRRRQLRHEWADPGQVPGQPGDEAVELVGAVGQRRGRGGSPFRCRAPPPP